MSAKDTTASAKPAAVPAKESARVDRLERALTNGLAVDLSQYDDTDQAAARAAAAEQAAKDAEKQVADQKAADEKAAADALAAEGA